MPDNPLSRLERIPIWPYSYKLLVMLGLGYFFSFFDITNVAYGIPVIQSQFHASLAAVSQAITFSLFGYIVGSIVVSVISDYWGRRTSLIIGILLYTVGSIATAFSMNLIWLVSWRFVVGMGIGTMIVQVSTYLGEISPAAFRGRFTGLTNVFSFAGLAAAPFVALAVVPEFSWGWRALLFFGGFGGLTILFMSKDLIESPRWLLIHNRTKECEEIVAKVEAYALAKLNGKPLPEPIPVPMDAKPKGFPIFELLKPPYLWRTLVLVSYFLLWYIGDYAYLGLAPTFLVKEGFGLAGSIGFSAISGVGFVVGALYCWLYGDRFERKVSVIVSGIIGGISMFIMGAYPSFLSVAICGFLFTVTIAVLSILGYVITAEHFPTRARSSGLAICDGVGHFGGAIAPAIALWANASWGFKGGFFLMGITTLACLIFISTTVPATRKTLEAVTEVA